MIAIYYPEKAADKDRFDLMRSADPHLAKMVWSEGKYIKVATFHGADLELAYKTMQNGVVTDSWVLNPGPSLTPEVEPISGEGFVYGWRSSSMGDIYEIDGKRFICAAVGFEPVP